MTPELEGILRNTVISEDEPGSILHDFEVMLAFAQEAPLTLTASLNPSMKACSALNERVRRKVEHGLTRPTLKSYPHIGGLFLLLRASGLTTVETVGRKSVLVVDSAVLASWRALTAEERYFALFESWLMRGDSEIIGEQRGRFMYNPIYFQWASFFEHFVADRWHDDDWVERVRYHPGFYILALMELFGLVEIEDGPVQAGQSWRIADVEPTAWGVTLLAALFENDLLTDFAFWRQLERPEQIAPGVLQPYLQPYRPDWQQTLQLPGASFQQGMFVFKVSVFKDVWREIFMPGGSTLEDLSDAILNAYDFDNDHLYRFLYATRFGNTAEVSHPMMKDGPFTEEGPYVDEVCIGDLPAQPGFHMIYNFDFGDNWNFDVLLERIDPAEPIGEPYRIGARHGESPPQYEYAEDDEWWDDDGDEEMMG
ncbi:MAG: hypothetical protein R2856_18525 [Caldilineaceae bacterium]